MGKGLEQVVVIAAKRTPVGKMGGCFKDVLPEDLLVPVIREVVSSTGLNEEIIDEVIIGQAKPTTDAPNIARVASLKAGLPEDLPAYSVHRQCGSGMQAIASAAWQIQAGYAGAIIAGGVESMSTAPYYLRKCRFGYVAGNGELVDPNTESQPKSQPEETYGRFTMGETAENLAEMYAISRKEQDEFAYRSHMRAIRAIDAGRFAEEIVQITIAKSKGAPITVGVDEGPRRDTNLEKLAALKPAFKEGGTVTAGNSSSRNDGAAALLLTSEKKAKEFGLKPIARLVSIGIAAVDPRIMGIGPVPATKDALKRAGLRLDDIDIVELNEAFAAQSLAVLKELPFDPEIVNVNGGAIALGHPLGCSGARITATLLHEMVKRKAKLGLAAICIAGGQGMATIYENLTL